MENITVYVKCERNVEVKKPDVYFKDLGSIQCADRVLCAKIKSLKVHHFSPGEQTRIVVSCLKLIEMIEGLSANITVDMVGEKDVLIEWVRVAERKNAWVWAKIAVVGLVSFFGTAFTIIGFHNDIDICKIFDTVYQVLMQDKPGKVNPLEISYSIGLAVGITVFFNHVGTRKLTKDPTPIAVSMHKYEVDVDETLVELASRQNKEEEPKA